MGLQIWDNISRWESADGLAPISRDIRFVNKSWADASASNLNISPVTYLKGRSPGRFPKSQPGRKFSDSVNFEKGLPQTSEARRTHSRGKGICGRLEFQRLPISDRATIIPQHGKGENCP
jgi:hypothetical protein